MTDAKRQAQRQERAAAKELDVASKAMWRSDSDVTRTRYRKARRQYLASLTKRKRQGKDGR